ncbi:MAG: ankyrin repeat domain-containing protein [Candidatus Xenobiia bacterium LiM19]
MEMLTGFFKVFKRQRRAAYALFCLLIAALVLYGCSAKTPRVVRTVQDMKAQSIEKAVREGDCAAIQQLLATEPSLVKVKDSAGYTPLHWAAIDGRKDVVALLAAKGADVNARNPQGATPLHMACGSGRKEAAEVLLKNGADMHSRDSNDNTPTARAEAGGHKDVVDLLRSFGARY